MTASENDETASLLSPEANAAFGETRGAPKLSGEVLSLGNVPQLQWIIPVANHHFMLEHSDLNAPANLHGQIPSVRNWPSPAALIACLRVRYRAEERPGWSLIGGHFMTP